mmetsp:Transcript_11102/g.20151  ORF Transcript_11102/g.20151 Transcript_11102/m.20151 type:complete len:315 (-) Transcript_11102:1766-2710(-)
MLKKFKTSRSSANGRQCRCCNALANSLEMVICSVELDARKLRKLCLQDLLCCVQHEVAATALAHPSKDHDMINRVELTILSKPISQVHSYSLVKPAHFGCLHWISHCFLDQLQALRVVLMCDRAHVRVRIHIVVWNLDASFCCKPCSTALTQVHVGDATMSSFGPWVCWCFRVQVQPAVAQLIDPAQQVAICVGITTTLAAAHGDAHDVALAKLLHCCKRCNLSIINDLQWNVATDLLGDPLENVHDLCLVDIRWDIGKDVAPSCFVVCTYGAGGTAPHGVNFWEWSLCQFQRVHNGLEVVVRIRVCDIPLRLF